MCSDVQISEGRCFKAFKGFKVFKGKLLRCGRN